MNNKLRINNVALAIIVAMFVGFTADMFAQNFINEGTAAVYNASCTGVIRMKCPTGEIQGTNGQGVGSIPIGTNAANAIQGTVDWAAPTTAGTQTVRPYYYQRLVVSGNTKTMTDGIHVLGDLTACTTSPLGYPSEMMAANGFYIMPGTLDRAYFTGSTFYYDGDLAQTIYPESGGAGGNAYNILQFTGAGTKTIAGSVNVVDHISTTTSPTSITGTLTLGSQASSFNGTIQLNAATGSLVAGAGPTTFNQNVTVTDGQIIIGTGSGDVTVASGASLDLAAPSTASITLAGGENLIITGNMTNANTTGSNLNFDCASNVIYDATSPTASQTIMQTYAGKSYGNLILLNSPKTAGGDLYVCNNFNLAGGNLNMDPAANNYTIHMLSPTGTALYGASSTSYVGNEEVIGKFERAIDKTAPTNANAYTLNNRQTIVTIPADVNAPSTVTFSVQPGVNPYAYNATTDVNRKINIAYSGNAGEFTSKVRVGYLEGERTWDATYTQASLRLFETNAPTASASEKIGTGSTFTRGASTLTDLGFVELNGIKSATTNVLPNGIGNFASANDLVLRSGPTTFYTVQNGRWTNPNTWDEGTIPTANDDVEIRHVAYVGIRGGFATTTPAQDASDVEPTRNAKSELSQYGSAAAAKTITIAGAGSGGQAWTNASLFIGNQDNPGYTFRTATPASASTPTIMNYNTAPMTLSTTVISNSTPASATLNGLYLTNLGNDATHISIFETNYLLNKGAVNNEGIIEVGTICAPQ